MSCRQARVEEAFAVGCPAAPGAEPVREPHKRTPRWSRLGDPVNGEHSMDPESGAFSTTLAAFTTTLRDGDPDAPPADTSAAAAVGGIDAAVDAAAPASALAAPTGCSAGRTSRL